MQDVTPAAAPVGTQPSAPFPAGRSQHPALPWLGLLDEAQARMHAATLVLHGAHTRPSDAVALLQQGWSGVLHVALAARPGAAFSGALPPLQDLLHAPLDGVVASRVLPLVQALAHGDIPPGNPRRTLLHLAYELDRAVATQRRAVQRVLGRPPWRFPTRPVLGTLAVFLVLLGLTRVAAYQPYIAEHGWRGQYFDNEDFTGGNVVRQDTSLAFMWGEAPALPGHPADHFSVRWDSCMNLDKEARVTFLLGSDDGARLFLDGKLLIDHGGIHEITFKEGSADLPMGIHHVRVDYVEVTGSAGIQLRVGLDGAVPEPPEPGFMLFPGLAPPPNRVCGNLSS
jgi:hypothetical protein